MGDIGTALMNAFGGGGGSSAPSGGGAGGGNPIGDLFSSIGNLFGGGGTAPTPAASANAVTQALDPTGSLGAATAITPPSLGTAAAQTGDVGGTQSNAPQPAQGPQTGNLPPASRAVEARESGIDAIRKLIEAQRGGNPYQPGGGQDQAIQRWENEGGANRAPTPKPGLGLAPGRGGQFLPQWQSDVDIPAIPGISAPTRAQAAGPQAVQDALAPPQAEEQGPLARSPRAAAAGQAAVEGATAPAPAPAQDTIGGMTTEEIERILNTPLGGVLGAGMAGPLISAVSGAGIWAEPRTPRVDPRISAAGTQGFDVEQPLGAVDPNGNVVQHPGDMPHRPVTPTPTPV